MASPPTPNILFPSAFTPPFAVQIINRKPYSSWRPLGIDQKELILFFWFSPWLELNSSIRDVILSEQPFHNSLLSISNYSLKLFYKTAGKKCFQIHFYNASPTLISKLIKAQQKENYRARFLMNIYARVFNKILKIQTEQLIYTTYFYLRCVYGICLWHYGGKKPMLTVFFYSAPPRFGLVAWCV